MTKQAYVLYANDTYFDIVSMCAKSIRQFSDKLIIVYMLNSDKKVAVPNTKSVRWNCNIDEFSDEGMYHDYMSENNFYINRSHNKVYNLLIQRPLVVKHALTNYADVVVYVDCDSVATPYVDSLFGMYSESSIYPYITEGIYSHLMIDGKGGTKYEDTIEYNACELFGTNQDNRKIYRTTNIFVAGQNTIPFLEEWYWMCTHPAILKDFKKYAPFHEETIVNVLLWKNNYQKGLPYIYVNADVEKVDRVFNRMNFTGDVELYGEWFRVPGKREDITFFHGEKRIEEMQKMLDIMKNRIKILFLAPHLSTGGMPAFLLKRIEVLSTYDEIDIYVVEHSDLSPEYIVQKKQIKQLVKNFWTLGDDKLYLLKIIEANNIDIVHIDDVGEAIAYELAKQLYRNDRTWRIVETCHNVAFNPDVDKVFHPDAYAFCTPYHEKTFANVIDYSETIEFPIDEKYKYPKKTGIVLNVGLWTPGKNQAEGIEIARKNPNLSFYFVGNQAPNFKEYWEPLMKNLPENVTVWGERSDIDEFMKKADVFMFNSTWECNPLALREAISYGLPIIARNLPQYEDMFTKYLQPIDTDLNTIQANYEIPTDNTSEVFGKKHINFYNTVVTLPIKQKISPNRVTIGQHFIEQPFLEILGNSDAVYDVKFFDEDRLFHHDRIKANHWVRLSRRYYTKWRAEVWENDTLIYENTLNLYDKRVLISFDSSSLGDTIAWIPYALEFKKKHNCHVIVSSFWNRILDYPELEFVEPGRVVPNLYAQYKIGWFYSNEYEPALPNTINLQQAATNILGLDYQEIRPRISFTPSNNYYGKYVTIATNSTAGCKFWLKEEWQKMIDYLVSKDYTVVNVSKERNEFKNCIQIENTSMEHTMDVIHYSDFFIGLSSGLSWLAWALNKQVVMISNFTEDNHEFECIRVTNKNVCHGCWNNPNFKFDKGDWNWCPIYKNTPRQFECHTSITANDVISKLQLLL